MPDRVRVPCGGRVPFASGQDIKYTETNAKPSIRTMPGGLVRITGTGDAEVSAADLGGNTSAPVACQVAPPPR